MVLPLQGVNEETVSQLQADEAVLRDELEYMREEQAIVQVYRDYYEGDQTISFGTDRFKATFGDAFEGFRDNWCQVVADAMLDRLDMTGISTGSSDLDSLIWRIFQLNDFDESQEEAHTGALVEGRSTVIVWPDDVLGVRVDWNPAQLVRVRYSDDDNRIPIWAIKRWETPSGIVRVNIYTSDNIRKYRQGTLQKPRRQSGIMDTIPAAAPTNNLIPYEVEGEPWPLPNPLGEVPVVELRNRRNTSELKNVVPQQDAINYLLLAAFGGAEFTALRQRVFFTAVKEPPGGWDNSPGRIWQVPPYYDSDGKAHEGKLGEFATSDLSGFRELIDMMLQHVALTTKTPVRYFFQSDRGGRGDAPSGESLRVDDKPLNDKIRRRQVRYGNQWYRVANLIARAGGYPTPDPTGKILWKDPQSDIRAPMLEEAKLMVEMGIPLRFVIKHIGLNPEEISELEQMLDEASDATATDQSGRTESTV